MLYRVTLTSSCCVNSRLNNTIDSCLNDNDNDKSFNIFNNDINKNDDDDDDDDENASSLND